MIKETFPYYPDYEIFEQRRSLIDENKIISISIGFLCPRCKTKLPPLKHSEKIECDCGLRIQLWGNALECEADSPITTGHISGHR